MKQPTHAVGEREAALLERAGLTLASFEQFSNLTPGTRRPYLVWPSELQVAPHPAGLQLTFSLPSGSYATILLREFQKSS
jgi:tRNA pseudouridine13 synthase